MPKWAIEEILGYELETVRYLKMGKKQNVYKDSNGFYFKANLGKDPITGKRLTKTKRGFKTEAEAYRAYMVLC